MSNQTNISHIIFNQMSDTKYSTVTKTDGEFYVTPDYLDLPLLLHQYTDHKLNDISWLRSDTFSWQSGDVYKTVYDKLVSEYNNENSITKYAHTGIYSTNKIMTSNNTDGWVSQGSNEAGASWLAFNGDWTTSEQCWWTGENVGLPQWIQLKRPDKKFIKSIIVKNEVASPVSPYAGQIYGSNDGTNWTYIKDFQREMSNNATGYQTYELVDSAEPFMYCRLQITSSSSGNSVSIQEIQIEYEDYIEYKETPDGLRIANQSQESVINNSYNLTKDTWFYILDITNNRFKLPRKKQRKLIDEYHQGDQYYKIYSDGWCEQGSLVWQLPEAEARYWFLKPFIARPNVQFTRQWNSNNRDAYNNVNQDDVTTWTWNNYGFNTWGSWAGSGIRWVAYGYVDISSYNTLETEYLYFYVGNYTKAAIEQTAGINSEVLNGKMDNDLANLPSNIDYVVEQWADNNNWYRVYKSGWCEQGGYVYNNGDTYGVVYSISLMKAYRDPYYFINMWAGVGNSGWQYCGGVGYGIGGNDANLRPNNNTNSSFTYFNATGISGTPIFWETKGYIR